MLYGRNQSLLGLPHDLFLLEQMIAVHARRFGVNPKLSSRSVENNLHSLPADVLMNAQFTLSTLLTSFEAVAQENIDPWDDKEFFRITMRELKLSFHPDLLDRIEDGDVVEAYDTHRRQIFRNMRFMEASSYSLLEVLSYEWPVLFERPISVTEAIIQKTEETIWQANGTLPAQIPVHMIRELRSKDPQVVEVEFKYFSPLYAGPNQRGGFACSCRGQVREKVSLEKTLFI